MFFQVLGLIEPLIGMAVLTKVAFFSSRDTNPVGFTKNVMGRKDNFMTFLSMS